MLLRHPVLKLGTTESMADNSREEDESEEIFDNPGRGSSVVWKYFGFYKKKDSPELDKTVAICKLCRKSYAHKGKCDVICQTCIFDL